MFFNPVALHSNARTPHVRVEFGNSTMITLVVFCALFFLCGRLDAQTHQLPEAGIELELPTSKWTLTERREINNKIVYFFKREALRNRKDMLVIPNITFVIETIPDSTDVVLFSTQKRMKAPFSVDKVYAPDDKDSIFHYPRAVAYKGSYKDDAKRGHTVYVLHLIHELHGIQVFCDVTSDLFSTVKNDFLAVLRSIRASK